MKRKLMPTAVVKQQNEVEAVTPIVRRDVVISGLEPNILVAQEKALLIQTPNNMAPIFTTFTQCPTPMHELYHNEALLDTITQKFIFLMTDVYTSALNQCVNEGIINPNIVDLKDFRLDFVVGRHEIESDIALCTTRYCQSLYNKLYQYTMFAKSYENPESVVDYLNNLVSYYTNLITHHISNYYNEMITVVGIFNKDYTQIEAIGKFNDAYIHDNVVGMYFSDDEDKKIIEKNNEFIAYSQEVGKDFKTAVEFEFNKD